MLWKATQIVTLDKIKNALVDPFKVIQSKHSNKTCLFYSFSYEDPKLGFINFCVVVEVTGPGKGKILTAYEANFIKSGKILYNKEDKKWMLNTMLQRI